MDIAILDFNIFWFINHLSHAEPFNTIGLAISGFGKMGLIWYIMGLLLFLREEKKSHWFWVPLITAGLGSWAIVELFLKKLIARPRPTVEMGAIIVGNGNGFSFPSGHATIAFAMAAVLSHKEPRLRWVWYLLALAIGLSRIYLGKHYPTDVAGGAIIGWLVGFAVIKITSFFHSKASNPIV